MPRGAFLEQASMIRFMLQPFEPISRLATWKSFSFSI